MQQEPAAAMRQLIMGFRTTQLVYVAAKLGLADRLAGQPGTAAELAGELGAHPEALYRVLRALSTVGVFAETPDGRFGLTALGELLRSNVPVSMRNVALLYGDGWVWQAYGNMLHSVMTGQPAFYATHGKGFYEFLDQHATAEAVFQAAMDDFSNNEAAAVLKAYSFKDVKSIVDIGSGRGALLAAILEAHPQLEGLAFDMPAAERECMRRFQEAGLTSRAAFVGGDFFRNVPEGRDLYLLKSVLHNWDDGAATRILEVCRQAISPSGRLLIIERVIADGQPSAEAKLFDVNMLVTVGGRERTEQEYRMLLAGGGFTIRRMYPTASPLTIIEAAGAPG
jgi:SAM-dependent methyltransferase